MARSKVAITIDEELLQRLDSLVAKGRFPSRSRAIQEAVEDKFSRMDRSRLAREAAKLDVRFEQQLADEGLQEDLSEWPDY